jgi:hypothetical protein
MGWEYLVSFLARWWREFNLAALRTTIVRVGIRPSTFSDSGDGGVGVRRRRRRLLR